MLHIRTKNGHTCPLLKRQWRVGRHQSRELGNLAAYLRYKPCLRSSAQVSLTRDKRLFNKNTADC